MSAYIVIIRKSTLDPSGMEKYKSIAKDVPTLKMKILATKQCEFKVLEGQDIESTVIMEFPTMEDALEWYQSDAYQEALPYRLAASDTHTILVDGCD
jgi:uncharacterized protein (DUF1330 family)